MGSNICVSILPERIVLFSCVSKGHKMRDCPKIKERGKEVNQAPQSGLDLNAPKKSHPYGMGARKDN